MFCVTSYRYLIFRYRVYIVGRLVVLADIGVGHGKTLSIRYTRVINVFYFPIDTALRRA